VSTTDPSLDVLAVRHGADKSSRVHGYTRAYELHFALLRHQAVSLLEIGVGSGASLRMWRDYFPQARLYGLDIAPCQGLQIAGLRLFQGSQRDESVLERLVHETGPLDIIIDDGSHRWADQIASFQKLFPHVKPGGCYAIEDLHTSYWDAYKSGEKSTMAFLTELVHTLQWHGKSGYGEPANDPEFRALQRSLNVYQATMESIMFCRGLALVHKRPEDLRRLVTGDSTHPAAGEPR
jgi:hypothetical protein